ncbi:YfhO family protein [Pedosphaera parvula]|uniref:Bacterial membrane protein YfhO n=1 Tax=Pedosphaera parvula (strain Ellin514) TaxID=320771 RepID=B9XNS1_PEDPL|nr:YfhO family protein [Pedosphaera parvula]EEF58494.1 hypothetical protein Cflav_PD1221 [Pedosphaera parvula Ellin514]
MEEVSFWPLPALLLPQTTCQLIGSTVLSDSTLETKPIPGTAATSAIDGRLLELWFTPVRFGLLLAVLILASFPEVIFGNQSFIARDFGLFSYPVAYYHKESFWRHELPLWNPLHNCGIPFLAQFNTITLYPLSLIYLMLPLDWSLGIFCLVHIWIAGMGMYFLAHRWTGNRFAASIAGLAFAFNGLSLNFIMWPSHLATYSWMPWVIWSVEKAWQRGGRAVLWAALLGSLQMLSGGPETILMTWLVVLPIFVRYFVLEKSSRWTGIIRFFGVIILVTGLSAAQLFPFLDLIAHSQRNSDYAQMNWSTPGTGWANFFVPLFGCFLTRKGIYFQDNQYWTSSYYVGIAVVALAMWAIWRVRKPRVWFLAVIALLGILLAMGENGLFFRALKIVFHPIGFMAHPVKFILLAVFALPLLAAFAIAELPWVNESRTNQPSRSLLVVGSVVALVILGLMAFAHLRPADHEEWQVTCRNGVIRLAFLALTLSGLAALRRFQAVKWKAILAFGLPVLLWGDVNLHAPPQNPTTSRDVLQPGLFQTNLSPKNGQSRALISGTAAKQMLEGTSGDVGKDFLFLRKGLFLNSNLLDETPTLNGFYSLYLESDLGVRALLGAHSAPFLDFVGVSIETAPDDIFKFVSRNSFLSMITGGQKPIFTDRTNMLPALADSNFDPRAIVYLPMEVKDEITVSNRSEVRILSQTLAAQKIELEVAATVPSLMVAAQSFYHPWHAWINDQEVKIYPANYHFQAWQIPPGQSHVRLEYKDRAFEVGALLSILSLGVGAGLFWSTRKVSEKSEAL